MTFDPWTLVHTRHGLVADEVISALQKEIRRGNVENAVCLAYEMFTTSPELAEVMWSRLQIISVEDIGWGDLQAPVLINALYEMQARQSEPRNRGMYAVHAVRFLATRVKDRSSDEMYAWLRQEDAAGRLKPVIPDYALDMHTRRGAEMGRDRRYFYEESAQVSPELEDRYDEYKKRLLASLNKKQEC